MRSALTVASWASHISDAKRGSPAFSGRNSTPHSTQLCCNEIAERRAGSTVSSAPQKPTQRRWIVEVSELVGASLERFSTTLVMLR